MNTEANRKLEIPFKPSLGPVPVPAPAPIPIAAPVHNLVADPRNDPLELKANSAGKFVHTATVVGNEVRVVVRVKVKAGVRLRSRSMPV